VSTEAEYQAAVRQLYGAALGNAVLTQYPASRFMTPQRALVALTTDATWTCPARRIARALAASQTAPVHRYFFTWRAPGAVGLAVGATHGLEIPFVFRTFSAFSAGFVPDADALSLSDTIQEHWVRLAATGTLDSSWPRFPANGDVTLELGATVQVLNGVRTADCDFLDSLRP
jgi:para-nitrobenzyl esterase